MPKQKKVDYNTLGKCPLFYGLHDKRGISAQTMYDRFFRQKNDPIVKHSVDLVALGFNLKIQCYFIWPFLYKSPSDYLAPEGEEEKKELTAHRQRYDDFFMFANKYWGNRRDGADVSATRRLCKLLIFWQMQNQGTSYEGTLNFVLQGIDVKSCFSKPSQWPGYTAAEIRFIYRHWLPLFRYCYNMGLLKFWRSSSDGDGLSPPPWITKGKGIIGSYQSGLNIDPERLEKRQKYALFYQEMIGKMQSAWNQAGWDLALNSGNPEAVAALLKKGVSANMVNQNGDTPLLIAVRAGNIAIMKLLLDAQAYPDAVDQNGNTVLMIVVYQNNSEAVELLLNAGATPDVTDQDGDTPLMIAEKNNPEIAKLLLDAGATPSVAAPPSATGTAKNNGETVPTMQESKPPVVPLLMTDQLNKSGMGQFSNSAPQQGQGGSSTSQQCVAAYV
jgi:hypothetical protein